MSGAPPNAAAAYRDEALRQMRAELHQTLKVLLEASRQIDVQNALLESLLRAVAPLVAAHRRGNAQAVKEALERLANGHPYLAGNDVPRKLQ